MASESVEALLAAHEASCLASRLVPHLNCTGVGEVQFSVKPCLFNGKRWAELCVTASPDARLTPAGIIALRNYLNKHFPPGKDS